jgi:hypothetical protein
MFDIKDQGGIKFQAIRDVCAAKGSGCGPPFDLKVGSQNAIKFNTDTLHVRNFVHDQLIVYHWDRFNIHVDFFKHLWVDTFMGWWRGGGL